MTHYTNGFILKVTNGKGGGQMIEVKRISFYVPVEVHHGYKLWCAKKGQAMRVELVELVNKIYKAEQLKKRKK